MSAASLRHRLRVIALLLLIVMTLSLVLVGSAGAEGGPHPKVPGYPKSGCYALEVQGMGMWNGTSLFPFTVRVPGPVVDAYMVWLGSEDFGDPAGAPQKSTLSVNGATVVGDSVDSKVMGGPTTSPWYMYRANIGPNGYNLVNSGGDTTFNITGWAATPSDARRNGVSVMVVYSTGDCDRPNMIDLIDNMDWFWERSGPEAISTPLLFTFPPAEVDREVTVWLDFAGADHKVEFRCRPENVWSASGAGTPPDNIINYPFGPGPADSTGVNGGKKIVTWAFHPNSCGLETTSPPLTAISGGYIDAEWSLLRLKLTVPAGNTWLIMQGESPNTGALELEQTGESGAWFAQASIPLYEPEIRVVKTAPATANPGDTIDYAVAYDNHGFGAAENTKIVDTLPERVTFVGASGGGVFNPADHTITWNVGTLGIGNGGTVTATVTLDPVFPAGTTTLTNQADITTDTPGEVDISDNKSSATTDVLAKVELTIAKAAAPEPVEAGGDLTYTVTWSVGGNAFAPGVAIVDTLPVNVTFVSASNGGVFDPTKNKVTWSLGEVTPVKSDVYTVNVKVKSPLPNGTQLTNNVTIADSIGDSADASAISTVHSDHVLTIEKAATPEPVEAGANLTYTVTWGVTGNEPSPNAMVVDTLPPDKVTFVSASGGGVYDPVTRKVTWSLGNVPTPQSGSFNVVVAVDTPLINGTKLTNTVDFKDDDPQTAAAHTTVESTVHSDHEFVIGKIGVPDPVAKGGQLAYTITWKVMGNEPADAVVITDSIPFGTMFVSASAPGVYDAGAGKVTWALGNLVPPQNGEVTLVVQVNRDFPNGLDIVNRATIGDNKPGKEKTVEATTKVVQTAQGSIGDTVWYDTNGNKIQEPGEPGLAGVGLVLSSAGNDNKCDTAGSAVLANTTTDSNGKYRFSELVAGVYCVKVVDATVPAGLVPTFIPTMPVTLVEGQEYRDADFGYAAAAGSGVIGDLVWSDANGSGVRDPGEVGIGNVTLDLMTTGTGGQCNGAGASVIGTRTTAADGSYLFTGVAPGTYCVKVTDTNNVLAGQTLTGGTNPHGPINLPAGGSYLNADFGYKGATGQIGDLVFYDGNRDGIYEPGPVERGIAGVTLSLLGAGDAVVGTAVTDGSGNYMFTGVANGNYKVLVTDVNGRLTGYTQTYGAPNTDNNGQVSPYSVTIAGGNTVLTADFAYADGHLLSVTKKNDVPFGQPVEAGAQMVYTIGYSVSGRETAPNVVLQDLLPMQVDFVSASNGGVYDAQTRLVSWNLGNLNPGDSGTRTITVIVKMPLENGSYIFNTAKISDDAKVTDEATDVVRVHAAPVITLAKSANPPGEVKPGDTIHYTVCAAQTGNGVATGVVLVDALPEHDLRGRQCCAHPAGVRPDQPDSHLASGHRAADTTGLRHLRCHGQYDHCRPDRPGGRHELRRMECPLDRQHGDCEVQRAAGRHRDGQQPAERYGGSGYLQDG